MIKAVTNRYEEDMIWGNRFEKEISISPHTDGIISISCRMFGIQ